MSYTIPPALIQEYRNAVEEALTAEAYAVLAKAKPITPRELGNLEATGEVLTFWIGDIFFAVVGFGGTPETAPYAEYQHERTDLKHDPPRQAKYLEQPAMDAMPGMDARVGAYVARKVGV